MRIPSPKAHIGETVLVRNYRSHRKDGREVWEVGRISAARYGSSFGEKFRWSYDIRLERVAKSGYSPMLYVGNSDIKKR